MVCSGGRSPRDGTCGSDAGTALAQVVVALSGFGVLCLPMPVMRTQTKCLPVVEPMNAEVATRILFVCMGNICRSPTAEGVMRKLLSGHSLADAVELDSAGTHAYHVGEPPDDRAVAAALARGIDLTDLRARRVEPADFERFDYILAMDADNLQRLQDMQPESSRAEVRLLLDYSREDPGGAVPDPYYGGATGFERVLDLLEEANQALLERLAADS